MIGYWHDTVVRLTDVCLSVSLRLFSL